MTATCPMCGSAPQPSVVAMLEHRGDDERPWWCSDCLNAKVQAARSDGECRCGASPEPHRHDQLDLLSATFGPAAVDSPVEGVS